MKDLGDVFGIWDSLADMAADVSVTHEAAKGWGKRKRIPDRYWPTLIKEARRKGHKLSADDLLLMHAKRRTGSALSAGR